MKNRRDIFLRGGLQAIPTHSPSNILTLDALSDSPNIRTFFVYQ